MAEVRSGFARTGDGMQLYYRVVGEGPPMVCCNGVGVSTFFWKYIARHFRDRYSVVVWDYRGHGRSSVPPDVPNADLSMERCARDLELVLDTAGIHEPGIFVGHSMGCQVILEAYRHYPRRIKALIPMFGTFAKPMDTFMDYPHSRKIFDAIARFGKGGGKLGSRLLHPIYANPLSYEFGRRTGLMDPYYASRKDMDAYMEHLVHMDPQVFLRMVEWMADHDLTDFLPQIDVPVLIFAGEKDLFTPLHRSHLMHDLLPSSELFIVAEGSHAAIVEHPETINRRIDRFIAERLAEPKAA